MSYTGGWGGGAGVFRKNQTTISRQREGEREMTLPLLVFGPVLFGCWGNLRALAYSFCQVLHISWHLFTNHKKLLFAPDLFSSIFPKPVKTFFFFFHLFYLKNFEMQMFVSRTVKIPNKRAFKQKKKKENDVKYEFWPFDIIPNINRPVLSASLFVLWNECTLASCTVRTLMLGPSCWTRWLRRLVEGWHLNTGCFLVSKQKPWNCKKQRDEPQTKTKSCWFLLDSVFANSSLSTAFSAPNRVCIC